MLGGRIEDLGDVAGCNCMVWQHGRRGLGGDWGMAEPFGVWCTTNAFVVGEKHKQDFVKGVFDTRG